SLGTPPLTILLSVLPARGQRTYSYDALGDFYLRAARQLLIRDSRTEGLKALAWELPDTRFDSPGEALMFFLATLQELIKLFILEPSKPGRISQLSNPFFIGS